MNSSPPDLLTRIARKITEFPFEGWHFGDSIAFDALMAVSRVTGEPRWAEFVRAFGRGWFAGRDSFRPMDCTVAGAALCEAARASDDATLIAGLVRLADYLCARTTIDGVYQTWAVAPVREPYGNARMTKTDRRLLSEPGPGVFIDCVHFDPPFLAALAEVTGDQSWMQQATTQATGYIRLLQDPATGLFHHFFLQDTGSPYILGWGRGQGWALLGLLQVAGRLNATTERTQLDESIRRLIRGMIATQRADGHWAALITDPDSPDESSTAAFMAAGFLRALALGVIGEPEISEALAKAEQAVLDSLTPAGVLAQVSAEVWASTVPGHYANVPRGFEVPWGQGPLALWLAEREHHALQPELR